jgi:hypothetical protein
MELIVKQKGEMLANTAIFWRDRDRSRHTLPGWLFLTGVFPDGVP